MKMKVRYVLVIVFFSLCCFNALAMAKLPSGVIEQRITVQGQQRQYFLFLPNQGKSADTLVMLFHGHGGSAENMLGMTRISSPYARWLEIAKRENFLLLIPNGELGGDGKRGWADCRLAASQPRTDDLAFVDAMLQATQRQRAFKLKRIYASGTSNGGHFVLRLAHERAGLLTAAAVIVASEAAESRCSVPKKALPILFMNGTEDPLSKWNGGQVGRNKDMRGSVLSVTDTIKYWVRINRAEPVASKENLFDVNQHDKSRVIRHKHAAKPNGKPVVLYEIRGGGHTEPSIRIPYSKWLSLIVGNQNRDIEMADTVWEFFEKL
jgi:polyhydroxybutyrate depolymerase